VRLNSNLGRYTNFVNLLDSSAIAIPAGFRPDGLPAGVTLIAPAFCDDALAALGQRLHEAGFFGMGCDREAVDGVHLTGTPIHHPTPR
jgi:allophanate hydrolase